jgi:hypothetical protein
VNFTFLHRPDVRKFNYKPQFFISDDKKSLNADKFDREEFGEKLKNSWKNKRKIKKNQSSMRNVIWIAFILLLLLFLVLKFVFKNYNQ